MAEVLERAMDEFVATTPVSTFDDFLSNNEIISPLLSIAPAYPASSFKRSKCTRCLLVPSTKLHKTCLNSSSTARPFRLFRIPPNSRCIGDITSILSRYRTNKLRPPREVNVSFVIPTPLICTFFSLLLSRFLYIFTSHPLGYWFLF